MKLLSIAIIIATMSSSIGEAAMYGYLKGIPQELIFMYNLGKQGARFFGIILFGVLNVYGTDKIIYFLPIGALVLPYILCFNWIDEHRLTHRQEYNVYRLKEQVGVEEEELIEDLE